MVILPLDPAYSAPRAILHDHRHINIETKKALGPAATLSRRGAVCRISQESDTTEYGRLWQEFGRVVEVP